MPFSFQVEGAAKDQLVVSLAALLLHDSNVDISADNIDAVVKASNNTVPAYYATLFSSFIEKAGGVEKFLVGPSAGGAGKWLIRFNIQYTQGISLAHVPIYISNGPSISLAPAGAAPAAAAAAPAAAKKEEKPKEEEVDALDGGMDMFGGGGGGGGY